MTNLQMFSIYDVKAETYSQPIAAPTVTAMMRILGDVLAEGQHAYAKHPEDYVLFHLGEFDVSTGIIDLFGAPNSLVPLKTLVPQ